MFSSGNITCFENQTSNMHPPKQVSRPHPRQLELEMSADANQSLPNHRYSYLNQISHILIFNNIFLKHW